MPEDFLKVEIDWNGVDVALASVAAFGDDLRPLGPPLYEEWWAPMEASWFQSEGTGQWKVSEAYAKRKEDRYGNLPIEQLPDQTLLKSFTDKDAAGAIYDVRADEIAFGSEVIYAGVQDARNPLIPPDTEENLSAVDLIAAREWASYAAAQGLETL